LTACLLVAGCSQKNDRKNAPAQPAVPITAASAVRQDVPVTLNAIGSVQAYNTVNVTARVTGELTRVAFEEGRDVRKGDLLLLIDPRSFDIALQAAEADSARDSARAASAAALEQRYADILQKEYVTQQQYEEAKADSRALQATIASDAAACRNARLNLSYCFIRAPISGRTGSLLVREGNLVRANDTNPLVVIQQVVPVYVAFSVPEQYLPSIRAHASKGPLRVDARVSGDSIATYTGELTLIDNTVDPSTGTIKLKATFPNTEQALWPGQFVDLALTLATRHDAVVIPASAVQKGQQGDFVFVVKADQTVAVQPVATESAPNNTVIVDRGLQADDRVVTDGQLRLSPGAKVDIRTELTPPEKPAGTERK
jgi:multidrug efflux system membrane fusion protein